MSNYQSGHDAEQTAAEYLEAQGYKILELNWKTKFCEIDIVAEKQKSIFFVEVKSRSRASQGFGMDYVTAKKLRQMRFAAEMWVHQHRWEGAYQLAAISIDADNVTFIEQIDF